MLLFVLLLQGASPVVASVPFADVVVVGTDRWKCSGVLVDDSTVLTSAHCLPVTRVGVGARIDRLEAVVHVASSLVQAGRDVAVLRLRDRVSLRAFSAVAPRDAASRNGVARLVGFGAHDPKGLTMVGIRRVKVMPSGAVQRCAPQLERTGCRAEELVAASTGALDSCEGDSGAPLFERDPKSPTGWRVVALASRAIASSRHPCGDGGIYVVPLPVTK